MIMLSLHITVTRLRSTTTAPYQIHIFIPVVIGVVGRIVITAVVRKDYSEMVLRILTAIVFVGITIALAEVDVEKLKAAFELWFEITK